MAKYRILIVDKNQINTRILKMYLLNLEHDLNIIEVLSGEAALKEMSKKEINLMITNFNLPGLSGGDLIATFKEKFPNQKTILMNNQNSKNVQRQAFKTGADAFISKPVDKAGFLDTVERTLGIVSSILPSALRINHQINEDANESNGIKKRTGELKIEVNPYAIFLINKLGEIILREGALSNKIMEETLFNEIISLSKKSSRNSILNDKFSHITPLNIRNKRMDIHFSHVGQAFLLLTICEPCDLKHSAINFRATKDAAVDLYAYLSKIGVNTRNNHISSNPSPYLEKDGRLFDSALALLFKNNRIKKHDADLFWDNILHDDLSHALDNIESFNYDQAFELRIMPANKEMV